MKNKILWLIATATIVSSAQAGVFSTVSGMTMEEVEPLSSYTIDTAGVNPRVYEFVPKNDKTKLCIVVFGNADGGVSIPAMQCFKRDDNK